MAVSYTHLDVYKRQVVPSVLMLVINIMLIYRKLTLSPLKFLRRDLSRSKKKKAVRLPAFSFMNRFRIRIILQNKSGYILSLIHISCPITAVFFLITAI